MDDLDRLIEAVEAGDRPWREPGETDWPHAELALLAFGGDLNAALRLHRELFADWVAVIHTDGGVVLSDANMDRNYSAFCNDNPARALLLAILRALSAQRETKNG